MYSLITCHIYLKTLRHFFFLVDSIAIQVLINKLKTTTIKDYAGETDTPLGHFEYDLTE